MAQVIAVAGKGGSGKTTLSALLVRGLLARGVRPILAVDADPNSNLGEALGLAPRQTLGALVDQLQGERDGIPAGMTRDAFLEMQFHAAVEESAGFDLLTMGRGEGPGCYCSVNNVLRALMEKLAGGYRAVVIDNEAGLEHLSRRTARRMDVLLVVSDYAVRGLRAARRIAELADEMNLVVNHRGLVLDRVPAGADPQALIEAAGGLPLELLATVPHDDAVVRADLTDGNLLRLPPDAPAVRAADDLLDRLLPSGPGNAGPPAGA